MQTTLSNWTSNPTPANTGIGANSPDAELTQMIREDLFARTLRNIARRAENLWADGYAFMPGPVDNGLHFVFTPKGDCYVVSVADDLPRCSCPAFAKYGECKHHLAAQWKLREDAEVDRQWERAEEVRNFFDSALDNDY